METNENKDPGFADGFTPAKSISVTLKYPFDFEGVHYETVTIRRVNVRQMAAFVKSYEGGSELMPPMIDMPVEAFYQIDDDDWMDIEAAMVPFLPRRLRGTQASPSATAEPT